jgi:hypothetical protein
LRLVLRIFVAAYARLERDLTALLGFPDSKNDVGKQAVR